MNIIYLIILFLISDVCSDITDPNIYCRDKDRAIVDAARDSYKLVDAKNNEDVMLQCHFCNEKDDGEPKIWHKQDVLQKNSPREVDLDVYTDQDMNRVFMTIDRELVIRNVTVNDTGLYICYGIDGEDKDLDFNFLLDIVETDVEEVMGNLTDWKHYQEKVLAPLNARLRSSTEPEVQQIRVEFQVDLEALTDWEIWGPCISCHRSQGERRRLGKCRLKSSPYVKENVTEGDEMKQEVLMKIPELSCHSELLAQMFPELGAVGRKVPDFLQTESCKGACSGGTSTSRRGRTAKKLKKRFALNPKAHLTLVCPGSTVQNVITWQKDDETLDRKQLNGNPDSRMKIDDFDTLYLTAMTVKDSGIYTCLLDDVIMLEASVTVVKSKLIAATIFVRHMAYLGFIFILSFILYCAGVIAAWTRRHHFHAYKPLASA